MHNVDVIGTRSYTSGTKIRKKYGARYGEQIYNERIKQIYQSIDVATLVQLYGEERGREIAFQQGVEQKISMTKYGYYLKYGECRGNELWDMQNRKKAARNAERRELVAAGKKNAKFSLPWFKERYGEEGEMQYKAHCAKLSAGHTLESRVARMGTKGCDLHDEFQKTCTGRYTLKWYVEKYGAIDGAVRFEQKRIKHSNALSLQGRITRLGAENGIKAYNDYCSLLKYSRTMEYFIETYGEEDGKLRFSHFKELQSLNACNKPVRSVSNISRELFDSLAEAIDRNAYYGEREFKLKLCNNRYCKPDFYSISKHVIVEFYGDWYHMNPAIYAPDYHNQRTGTTARDKWQNDARREELIRQTLPDILYISVWEKDYRACKENIIAGIVSAVQKHNLNIT